MAHFLKEVQEAGIKTSIDAVSDSSGKFAEKIIPALKYTDNAIMNEIEGCAVIGIAPRDENGNIIINNIRKAMEDLKHHGAKLTRELNQRRRVAELQERAASAEIAARAAEVNLANARAEIADLQQQAREQQEWMEQETTRSGKTIWEFFLEFITKQRERDYIDHSERE